MARTPRYADSVLLGAIIAVLAGVGLVLVGLRGRRPGLVPVCRRCSFELVGIALSAEHSPCPECGVNISAPGAIRRGHQRTRPIALVLGGLVLMAGVGLGLTTLSVASPALNAKKPAPLLVFEARFAGREASDAALTELLRRCRAGSLLGESFLPHVSGRLTSRALAGEASIRESMLHNNAPLPAWIEALALALETGHVGRPDRERLARRLVPALRWPISSRVPAGTMFSPTPVQTEGQSPLWEMLAYAIRSEMLTMEIDGEQVDLPTRPYVQVSTFGARPRSQRGGMTIARRSGPGWPALELEPGTRAVRATHRVAIFLGTDDPAAESTPDFEIDLPFEAEVRVYSDPLEVLTVVLPGPDVAAPRVQSFAPWGRQASEPWMIGEVRSSIGGAEGTVDAEVVWDIFRQGYAGPAEIAMGAVSSSYVVGRLRLERDDQFISMDTERLHDNVVQLAPGQSGARGGFALLRGIPKGLKHIDVVIVPDLDEAARRPYIDRVWGEPIRLRAELEWPEDSGIE